MRYPISILFVLCCHWALAQNWALFPLGQRNYYAMENGAATELHFECMDSVRVEGATTIQLFRQKLHRGHLGSCALSATEPFLPLSFSEWVGMDSMVLRNDSAFLYLEEPYTTVALFLPNAPIGAGWQAVERGASGRTEITRLADAEILVLGVLDSVRTYEVRISQTAAPASGTAYTLLLSKHHGIVEAPRLQGILAGHFPNGARSFSLHYSAQPTGAMNAFMPSFDEYFDLSPGDVRYWRVHDEPLWFHEQPWTEYYLDSIVQRHSYADSVIYTVHRTWQHRDGNVTGPHTILERYARTTYAPLLNSAPDGSAVTSEVPWAFIDTEQLRVWNRSRTAIEPGLDGTPRIRTTWTDPFIEMDTVACSNIQIPNWTTWFSMDEQVGLYEHCSSYSTSRNCKTLIAGEINGQRFGMIALETAELFQRPVAIGLYPTPATEHLWLSGPVALGTAYRIVDLSGRTLGAGRYTGEALAIDQLPAGMHALVLGASESPQVLRFLKQ